MNKLSFFAIIIIIFHNLARAKIPCNPESFQFKEAPQNIKLNQRHKFIISNRKEIGCAIHVTYLWEVLDVQHGYKKLKNIVQPDGYTTSTTATVDFSHLKDIYGYVYVLRVTLIPRPTHFPSYRLIYLHILPEEYFLKIYGGPNRIHQIGMGNLVIEFALDRETKTEVRYRSANIDCIPKFRGVIQAFQVAEINLVPLRKHNCTITVELNNGLSISASQTIEIWPSEKRPVLDIICIKNCENGKGNASEETILELKCYGHCDDSPAWSVRPFQSIFLTKFNLSNNILTVPANTFEHGIAYEIGLTMEVTTVMYTIAFGVPETVLNIICVNNCFRRKMPIVIKAQCLAICDGVLYQWDVRPNPVSWTHNIRTYTAEDDTLTFWKDTFELGTGATVSVHFLNSSAVLEFLVDEAEPDVKVICNDTSNSCSSPDPLQKLTLSMLCLANCDEIKQYRWILSPISDKIDVSKFESTPKLVIPKNSYNLGQEVLASIIINGKIVTEALNITFSDVRKLSIVCIENCNETDTYYSKNYLAILMKVNCQGYCENIYFSWSISPTSNNSGLEWGTTNDGKLFFLPKNYYSEDIDRALVTVSGGGSVASLTLLFELIPHEYQIVCIQNCLELADPAEDVIFRVICLKRCEEYNYYWRLVPENFSDHWYDRIKLSYRNETITLRKNSFNPLDSFELQLVDRPDTVIASRFVKFKDVLPQIQLLCRDNCVSWIHKTLVLELSCSQDCSKIGTLSWNYEPKPISPDAITFDPKVNRLYVPPFSYASNMLARFAVTIGKVQASYMAEFKKIIPIVEMSCSPHICTKLQNPFEEVTVTAGCVADCDRETFRWVLSPLPKNFSWKDHIIVQKDRDELIIMARTFQDQSIINVTLQFEGGQKSVLLKFSDPNPEIKVVCVDNCEMSDPHLKVHLKVNCQWHCQLIKYYNWRFEPDLPNPFSVQMGPQHIEIAIYNSVYKDGDIVIATAFWSKFSSSYKITYMERVPVLAITCLRNCDYVHVDEVIMKVDCLRNCTTPRKFIWFISRNPKEIEFFDSNKAIVIPPRVYKLGNYVNFTVCKGKGCTSKFATFQGARYKLHLQCVSSNCHGEDAIPSFETVFEVSCLKNCQPIMVYRWDLFRPPYPLTVGRDVWYNDKKETMRLKAYLFRNDTLVRVDVTCDGITVSLNVRFFQPEPILRLICKRNCGYSDPTLRVDFYVHCFEYCYNLRYSWNLFSHFDETTNSRILRVGNDKFNVSIPGGIFDDADTALLRVNADATFVEKQITFAVLPPVLTLICEPFCSDVNPATTVKIRVQCTRYCRPDYYVWNIWPVSETFIWALSIILSKDNETLLIKKHTFSHKTNINVSATSKKQSQAVTTVNYFSRIPKIWITCQTNCEYLNSVPIKLLINCEGECGLVGRSLYCELLPKPRDPTAFLYTKDAIFIDSFEFYSYSKRDLMTVTCMFKRSLARFSFRFSNYSRTGKCAIMPKFGQSTKTRHTIDCVDYEEGSIFYIYQFIPGSQLIVGALLYFGKSPYITNLILGPGWPLKIIVEVTIGKKVDHSSFFVFSSLMLEKPVYLKDNVSLRVDQMHSPWSEKSLKTLIKQFNLFEWYGSIGRNTEAYQLGISILATLDSTPEDVNLRFRERILNVFLSMTHNIEAFMLLNAAHIANSKTFTLAILKKILDLAYAAVQRVLNHNEGPYKLSIRMLENFGREILRLVLIVIDRSKIYDILTIPDAELHVFDYQQVEIKHATEIFEKEMIQTCLQLIDAGLDLASRVRNIDVPSYDFKTSSIRLDQNSEIEISYRRSRVRFPPYTFFGNMSNVTVLLGAVYLKGASSGNKETGEFSYVSVASKKTVQVQTFFQVFLWFKQNRDYQRIETLLNFGDVKVWKLNVYKNSTLEFKITGDCLITFSNVKPNREYVSSYGVRLQNNVKHYHVIYDTPLYIGVLGSENVFIDFVNMDCYILNIDIMLFGQTGCYVHHKQPFLNFIICNCQHLGLIYSTVHKISYNLDKNYSKTFTENVQTGWSVKRIVMILIFFIAAPIFFAIWRDRRHVDNLLWLHDNFEKHKEIYVISVQTGIWRNSGTTAHVSLKLVGTKGASHIHVLNNVFEKSLRRNSLDRFVLKTRHSLGDITHLKIWHDSAGKQPEWFCDSVTVWSPRKRKCFVFILFRWFSFTRPPFTINGLFKPISKKRSPIFLAKVISSMRSAHTNLFFLFGSRTCLTHTEHVLMTLTSILLVMLIAFLFIFYKYFSKFSHLYEIFTCITANTILTTFLDFIFRYSKPFQFLS